MSNRLTRPVLLALCLMLLSSLSARAAPTPRMLVETIDLWAPAISPDGLSVAFRQDQASIERNTYDAAWYVQPLDGSRPPVRVATAGEPLRVTSGPVLGEAPKWSADSRWIYYRALVEGAVQVWRAAADGSRAELVTRDAADVESFALSADGRRLFYTVGATRETIARAEQEEADRGVLIDPTVPLDAEVFHAGVINGRLADKRFTGAWMTRGGLLDALPKRQVVLDVASGVSRDATDADRAGFADQLPIAAVKASPTPTASYDARVRSDLDGSIAFIQTVGLNSEPHVSKAAASNGSITCHADVCHDTVVTGLAWRPGHDEVVFITRDRAVGGQSIYDWDLASGAVKRIASAPGLIGGGRGIVPGEGCAVSAKAAACVMAAADVPPYLVRVDLQTGQVVDLYTPNQALLAVRGPRAQFLTWTDEHGQVFTGQYFPAIADTGSGPAPLFINYYTCDGYLRGGLGDEWPMASLAGAGIAALCIQHPPIEPSDQVGRYDTALSGIRRIIDVLKARGLVDPTRVGLGGVSFGSEVVMWVAMKSNLLAAASAASPSLTPSYYLMHKFQGPYFTASVLKSWGVGEPSETPASWKRLSPAFNIDKIQTPLLMQMPEEEHLSALDYFVPLAGSTTPVELYVFPHEPHLLIEPRHLLAANDRNLDWFRFWLEGYADSDPAKADQYRRWEAMKARARDAGEHPGQGPSAPSDRHSGPGLLQP